MLVLSRKVGEEIVIDGCIRVVIASIKGDRVRVGVCAPPDVRVDRAEIHQRRVEFADTPTAAGSLG
jgi:carbon storage regulator